MLDQASKLREIVKDIDDNVKGTRIYSIISGKGGVGKTKFARNLESIFKEIGRNAIILDEDSDYAKGLFRLAESEGSQQKEILDSLQSLSNYQVIIIDNADGLSEESIRFTKLAHEGIMVTMPGVSSITETYKFLKVINQEGIKDNVKILVNNKEDTANENIFNNLKTTTEKFLEIALEDITDIKDDDLVELLYKSDVYDEIQLRDKILEIFG